GLVFVAATAAAVSMTKAPDDGPFPGPALAKAASELLASLTPEQKKKMTFTLEDAHRVEWFFVPIARKGVPLKELTPAQRPLVYALLKAGLGQVGYRMTTEITELDKVLAEIEKDPVRRDPEKYYVSIFGTPSATGTWGWRFEGHHVSHNFTIAGGKLIATTPQFLGANPAEVRVDGPFKGRRVLAAEEDLGRNLVTALDEKQRAQAIFNKEAPAEIVTKNEPKIDPLAPAGIAAKAMTEPQRALLLSLIQQHNLRLHSALGKERLERATKAGIEKVHFAWAGGIAKGEKYYYRVQGPTFLIEVDNTQNNGNHIHTVWRDFERDFGRDILREHLRSAHAL
ncbi:MAG TPA: DUF3500 domain-containing protein, partial [Polyangia bacterium]|nr:DUF3500 domain-containing protein [Polyangia bacterium]